jgi:hypothetical protein
MFVAWVSFYIFGKTLQGSLWAFLQIALGICMGVAMQVTAELLNPVLGDFGFPVSVFLYIGSLAYIARTRKLNNIPAWFLGLIILFGVHPSLEPIAVAELLIPIISGFIFASLNNIVVEKINSWQSEKPSIH